MKAYCQKYRLKKNKQNPIEKTITRCRSLIPNALEGDLRRSHQFEKFGIYGKRLENHFVKYTNALQNSSVLDIGRFAWYTNLLLTEVVIEKQKMYGIKFFGGNYFPNYSVIYLNFISLFISSVCFFFFGCWCKFSLFPPNWSFTTRVAPLFCTELRVFSVQWPVPWPRLWQLRKPTEDTGKLHTVVCINLLVLSMLRLA